VTPLHNLARHLGRKPWLTKISRELVHVDLTLQRLTRGHVALARFAGLTAVLLTTTGRKTGQQRTTPVIAVPDRDSLLIVGSNWGGPTHPGWSSNLIANPLATAQVRGHTFQVTTTLLTDAKREQAWKTVTEVWPVWIDYAERTDREIRVFRVNLR
jgi:deazaflavin-dependent oxidoreductase (nitroreductase family)